MRKIPHGLRDREALTNLPLSSTEIHEQQESKIAKSLSYFHTVHQTFFQNQTPKQDALYVLNMFIGAALKYVVCKIHHNQQVRPMLPLAFQKNACAQNQVAVKVKANLLGGDEQIRSPISLFI